MKNLIFAKLLVADLILSALLFAQTATPSTVHNQASPLSTSPQSQPVPPGAKPSTPVLPQRHRQNRVAARARQYYALMWGVDSLDVKSAEAGEMIRFSYRVVNADKAKNLNDKRIEPSLIDERAHVKLVVPMMDKVGKLRQTSAAEDGKTYWMLFSNKHGYVKRGDHVDVVIGNFHANGLVVD